MKTKIILSVCALFLLVVLVIGLAYAIPRINFPKKLPDIVTQPGYYQVNYTVDGDTIDIKMDGQDERVRLIGIDTPETKKAYSSGECYAEEAYGYLKEMLKGQRVRLEADPINTNRDRYNRLLRYVYLTNGVLVNSSIIQQGYGFAYLSFPFSKSKEFDLLQTEAKETGRGLWSGECQISLVNGRYKTNAIN